MSQIKWFGDKAKSGAKKGASSGLRSAAEELLTRAAALVPIEEGTLERSGVASVDEGELRAAVSFDTPYAVIQHEALEFAHDEGRQAKYLEDPLNRSRDELNAIIAREIKRELGA